MSRVILAALALAALMLSTPTPSAQAAPAVPARCDGTSYTYTGQANSDSWSAEKNWQPNGVPGSCASDSVSISPNSEHAFPSLQVPAGTILQSLDISSPGGGDVSLYDGDLTVTGSFSWSGSGSLGLPMTVYGQTNISDNSQKLLQGITLTLDGDTTLSGTGLEMSGGGASIINAGTFTFQPGAVLSAQSCCVDPATFVNQGGISLPGSLLGGGTATISAVQLQDTSSGEIGVAQGNTLELQVAPSALAAGVPVGGGGTLLIDNSAAVTLPGTVNLSGGTTLELGLDHNQAAGSLSGNGTLRGDGTFSWTGGTLAGDLTVDSPVKTSITGTTRKILEASSTAHTGVLTLGGPATVSGTGLVLGSGPPKIVTTGTLTLRPGAVISAFGCCAAVAQLVMQGKLDVPSGTATISAVALNTAASSQLSIPRDTVLNLQTAPSALAAGTRIGGGGKVLVNNHAAITLGGTVSLADGTTFELGLDQNQSAGSLSGTGTLSGDGTFSWTGGVISGDITVAKPVRASITGDTQKILEPGTAPQTGQLALGGDTTLSGTDLDLYAPAKITNTGTLTPQADSAISAFECCVKPAELVNDGRLDIDVGTGNSFSVPAANAPGLAVVNHGTVDLKSGTFKFGDPGYTQTDGETKLDGGRLSTQGTAGVVLKGGKLTGAGFVAGPVTNGASIDPGSSGKAGIIFVVGNYTQAKQGTLNVNIYGKTSSEYDQLDVTGAASLAGTLHYDLGRFVPAGDDQFSLMTYAKLTGKFDTLDPAVTTPRYWVHYKTTAAVFSYGPWGIDTDGTGTAAACKSGVPPQCTKITEAAYKDIKTKLGTPDFWGRYIGDEHTSVPSGCTQKDKTYSKDISDAEITEARTLQLPIWPVYFNYPPTAVTDAKCGQAYARAAIEFALHHKIPQGTALFTDIEPSHDNGSGTQVPTETSKEFITAWYDEFANGFTVPSPYDPKQTVTYPGGYYVPGYYARTSNVTGMSDKNDFAQSYCAAVKDKPAIATRSVIWTTRPGLTDKVKSQDKVDEPEWQALGPDGCLAKASVVGWQYAIDAPATRTDSDEAIPDLPPFWTP